MLYVPRLYKKSIVEAEQSYKKRPEEPKESKMFAPLDKAKPVTENIRGLNLAAVKHTTVQVTRLTL
jgi:hypothetical protein